MRLCRFTVATSPDVRIGLIAGGQTVLDLTDAGVHRMITISGVGTLENPVAVV